MIEIGGVLGAIVDRKRIDVAARLEGVTLDQLRSKAAPTSLSLAAALEQPGARFIMEVKRASPSEGALRRAADPAAIAAAYKGAADAISVLTDEPFFGGSFEDLEAVRAVFRGPILAKDFMIDRRQVPEARLHGADAILVMLSVLDDEAAAQIIEEAARLHMDVLVEAHDEDEVRRAVALGARIIGINNRDLKTLGVDLSTTQRLAGLVPADRILVSESGIRAREDVERLAPYADAFLVGSSLMKADDVAAAARALVFGRVKICGLTTREDLQLAAEAGASFAGLILVPGTPRAVTLKDARALAASGEGMKMVGVFRNEKLTQVALAAETLGLHAVQLHGEEDAGYIKGLQNMLPDRCEIWSASAVGDALPEPRAGSDRTLFDTAVGGKSGGTGKVFDWSRVCDREDLRNGLVAGGLTPQNAGAAAGLGAYALDVSSGVEKAPGRKDPAKLRAFFDALRCPARGDYQC